MSAILNRRLDKLLQQFGMDDRPIIAGRMEPQDWAKIKWNKDIQVILWYPDAHEPDRVERLADIERLKKCVSYLVLISQSNGYAVWENGQWTEDGGLGRLLVG